MDEMERFGRQSARRSWFERLVLILHYFSECVQFQKKVRIIIDYDPQKECVTISYYKAKELPKTEED